MSEPAAQQVERLYALNVAIRHFPESPSNYVLRGEFYLEQGAYEQAVADFREALEQAVQEVEAERWGIVAQSMQDRAQFGLEVAQQKLHAEK